MARCLSRACRLASRAARLPAFQAANPAHIDLFPAANVRLWDEITQSSTSTWTKDMAQAARTWLAYRQARLTAANEAMGRHQMIIGSSGSGTRPSR